MKKVLCDEWQKQNSMDSDAFFLCIMSHGGRHRDRGKIMNGNFSNLAIYSSLFFGYYNNLSVEFSLDINGFCYML